MALRAIASLEALRDKCIEKGVCCVCDDSLCAEIEDVIKEWKKFI